jgi:hypothetical protein
MIFNLHREGFFVLKDITVLFSGHVLLTPSVFDSFVSGKALSLTGSVLLGRTSKSIGSGPAWDPRDNVPHYSLKSFRGWNWWQLVKSSVFGKQPASGALGIALFSSLFKF